MVFNLLRAGFAMLLALCALAVQASDRVALVIGNSAYLTSPLTNPRNDASAMAALLTKAGFKVDMQLDADLPKMQASVDRFGNAIRDPNVKFGLFYYAGHGLQQDWRNYLVPVSAHIKTPTDVPKQTVDVSNLLRYMEKAQGRSFLVVLDACRNDPFAGTFRPAAKGLSQFDAPVGSLLAYATSPGNVAQDGEGENGLYTGFLLREFAVTGARLEDAFKRVRLSVRMASNGEQIPWESTSLEEDLYLFPIIVPKLTEAERDVQLEKEMTTWLRVKSSTDPKVLAEFIREYPSGSASELAQARMNRMLKVMADQNEQRQQEQAKKAALEAKELAAREEEVRRQAAVVEEKRQAALRAEEERVRLAKLEAAQEEARRQKAALAAAQAEESARLAKAKALAAEQEVQRLAAVKKEADRQSELQALAAAQEAQRAKELALQKAAQAQEVARLAEAKRVEEARLSELQQREAARLVAQAQALQAQEQQRLQLAQALAKREAAEREQAERVAAGQREQAQKAEQARLKQEQLAEQQRQEAARVLAQQQQQEAKELERQQLAQAQAKQQAAERAQAERVRLAQLEAAAEDQRQQQIAQESAVRAQAARLAQAAALASEQVAQRLVAAQQEAARVALLQAQTAVLELQRVQALQAEKDRQDREKAAQAERDRVALVRLADQQKQEAARLAAEKQALLAQVAKISTPAAKLSPTPYFKGYDEHLRQFSVGDEARIQVIDMYTKISKDKVMKVTDVDLPNERILYNDGQFASDLMGNTTNNLRGSFSTPRQFYPADLMVGKKWHTRFKQNRPNGISYTYQYDLKVVAKESITVPAGTFMAYKIEARGFNMERGAYLERNIWVAPGVNADIAHEIIVRLSSGRIEQADREELVSYTQAVK